MAASSSRVAPQQLIELEAAPDFSRPGSLAATEPEHTTPAIPPRELMSSGDRRTGARNLFLVDAEVADRPITPEDMTATILHCLGIDYRTVLHTPLGRPVPLADGGEPVSELFG